MQIKIANKIYIKTQTEHNVGKDTNGHTNNMSLKPKYITIHLRYIEYISGAQILGVFQFLTLKNQ